MSNKNNLGALVIALFVVWLGGGPSEAQLQDFDLDGVPDQVDICPRLPNARESSGGQPVVCGPGTAKDEWVFLQSRTFRPRPGLDGLELGGQSQMHALLHLERSDTGLVLTDAQRTALSARGVTLWDYLPHFTYYATLPASSAALQQILALDFVRGISGLTVEDRLSRSVRASGVSASGATDGRQLFSVELFEDASSTDFVADAASLGVDTVFVDESEHWVAVDDARLLVELAGLDGVFWIDDVGGAMSYDLATLDETATTVVDAVHGFTGSQLTIAMAEPTMVAPFVHDDLIGRVLAGNTGNSGFSHAMPVAGIMVGDGSLTPSNRGFLTEASLVGYATSGGLPKTRKTEGYWIPRNARKQHDAVLINNSWGPLPNCNKRGDYSALGKWWDKSVRKQQIAVITASGNTRGPSGDFVSFVDGRGNSRVPVGGPCERNLESLPHPVAKNDIAVGNWDTVSADLNGTSAVGPALDGRLKPDLVAPGTGIQAPSLASNGVSIYDTSFSGTSAAAPAISGLYGQVLAAFDEVATVQRDPLTVPPSTVKAILIHTAKDVGPYGPDYFFGWGLAQTAPAVRIATDWDQYVIEGAVDSSTVDYEEHVFDINEDRFGFKVTMVYDDKWGTHSSTQALVNDLDLVVVDPSDNEYYPLDTELLSSSDVDRLAEALEGARTCGSSSCADDRNNVEQVVISADGLPLEQGAWKIRVYDTRVETSDQSYSLVVSPSCPVRVFGHATLTADVECPYDQLEPVAVSLETDTASLDCQGYSILGEGPGVDAFRGRYAGVRTSRSGVSVRDCRVEDFDVGIDVDNAVSATIANVTIERSGVAGIRATGVGHEIVSTVIEDIRAPEGVGVSLGGQDHAVVDSFITPTSPRTGVSIDASAGGIGHRVTGTSIFGPSVGIDLVGPSIGGSFSSNGIFGATEHGIVVESADELEIAGNLIEGFGQDHAGVLALAAVDCDVRANHIEGTGAASQTAIALEATTGCTVADNPVLSEVGVGIFEIDGVGNEMSSNVMDPTEVGIDSRGSDSSIVTNSIAVAAQGIVLADPVAGFVFSNTVDGAEVGITVDSASLDAVTISGNDLQVPADGVGIEIGSSVGVLVSDNKVAPPASAPMDRGALGIALHGSTASTLSDNEVERMATCVAVEQSTSSLVFANDVTLCEESAIVLSDDSGAIVDANRVVDAHSVGVHYRSGSNGALSSNVVETTAGAPPSTHGILLGDQLAGAQLVTDLVVQSETVSGALNALTFAHGVQSATVTDSTLCAGARALNGGIVAPPVGALTIERNVLRGGTLDAVFLAPVDTLNNDWTEVTALNLFDADGDGYVDSGADHIFSSVDYTGTVIDPLGLGPALTSLMTRQVSDAAPVFGSVAACP